MLYKYCAHIFLWSTIFFIIVVGCKFLLLDPGIPQPLDFTPDPTSDTPDPIDEIPPATGYTHDELVQESTTVTFSGAAGADEYMHAIQNNSGAERTYGITVESGANDIWRLYFAFTNTNATIIDTPKASVLSAPAGTKTGTAIGTNIVETTPHPALNALPSTSLPLPIPYHVDRSALRKGAPLSNTQPLQQGTTPLFNMVGDSETFTDAVTDTTFNATVRHERTVGGTQLVIWVSDIAYTGCTGSTCLDELLDNADITDIADHFLKDDASNDVYDWVTHVIGPPWGAHGKANLIPATSTDQIHIVIHDIAQQGYVGGVVGYFTPVHNTTNYFGTKQRLMFVMDAPWVKWYIPYEGTDATILANIAAFQERQYYQFLSTLAHEFQHMIHFYQREVLIHSGGNTVINLNAPPEDTWINEMLSVGIEDLVTQALFGTNTNATDDRGLNTVAPGVYPICGGRVPTFLEQHYYGITRWDGELVNYAVNQAFNSYLIRNYGGAQYINNVYASTAKNDSSLTAGIAASDSGATFDDALQRWAVALLLSDGEGATVAERYRINNGAAGFSDTYNGVDYNYGSTNMYVYGTPNLDACSGLSDTTSSLRLFRNAQTIYTDLGNEQHGHSNIIMAAAEDLSGAAEYKITLQPGHTLTIVAKRALTTPGPSFY